MFKLRTKQLLALFLCGLMVHPLPTVAAQAPTTPSRAVLGSVTSRGIVRVGDVRVPGMSALFSGDQVQTAAGNAMVQYQDGARVILGNESWASFSSKRVELQKGRMSFSTDTGGPLFAASTLRIEPTAGKSAANVTLQDHKATVAVMEGSLKVVDPSGVELASLRAGEARLFEEASAALPTPAPAAAPAVPPPQASGGGLDRKWLVVLGIGMIAIPLAVAKGLRGNDADSCGEQLRTQLIEAQAQAAALLAQVRNTRTQLNALSAAAAQQGVTVPNLSATIAEANRLETQLSDVQSRVTRLVAEIDGPCGSETAAQQSELHAAMSDLNSLFQATQTFTNAATNLINQSGVVFTRTRLP